MPYVAQADITSEIPADFLTQALDDDGDGSADPGAWDGVAASVGTDIDAYVGLRYALPLGQPYPAVVLSAAKILACEKLYKRRGVTDDKNPWSAQASQTRTLLKSISLGTSPLAPELNRQDPSASVVTQPMRTASRGGRHILAT